MGFKFAFLYECAYTYFQITICIREYAHIAYVKSEKLLSDTMQNSIFIVE